MSGEVTSRIVVVGMSGRVPGADGVRAFEEMLFAGRTGYVDLPADRCDRRLYFDPAKGKTGKTYTTLGGVVLERPVNQDVCPLPTETQRLYDAAHVEFAEVAAIPNFHAYQAAALAARILGLNGPRSVIDAACASSLVAMHQAMMAIRAGRIDSAIIGGATYNNVDNLILFSHSQACTATESRPFDDGASGLVSSEGYVAVVITTEDIAEQHGLPILGVIRGVGMASDGRS